MARGKPTTVAQYIAAAPKESQATLRKLDALLRRVVPRAKRVLKWGSPAFEEKRILFAYSAYRSHVNFMPTRSSLAPFKKELAGFKTGRDTIQLPYDKPLPVALIRKIAKHRVTEVREENALWMHHEER